MSNAGARLASGVCGECGGEGPLGKRACAEHPDLCKHCYLAYQPQRACGICGRVAVIKRRGRDGQPDVCANCVPRSIGECGHCGKTGRLVYKASARRQALGYCCYRPPTRRCSGCGEVRPCRYAKSPHPLCLRCVDASRLITCASCGERRRPHRRTPDGPICGTCDLHQGGTDGDCRDCRAHAPLVTGRCSRCRLLLAIQRLRDEGDPVAIVALTPYLDALSYAENPDSMLRWLQTPTRHLLNDLLTGRIGLAHEALDAAMQSTHAERAVAFVRAALVHYSVLPERNEITAAFTRWAQHATTALDDGPDRALVRAYATWHVAHQLTVTTQAGKTGGSAPKYARSLVTEAIKLTCWLHAQELKLADLHQDLTDEWVSEGGTARRRVRLFLAWLTRTGTTGSLHVAWHEVCERVTPLGDLERFEILRTLLHNEGIDARVRLAGSLLLLYAQPLTRTARLRRSDIQEREGTVGITLARGVLGLPEPLGRFALEVRENAGTSDWLFPGRYAGGHLTADQILVRLKPHRITSRAGRHGALLALAARLPAPILAERLGFHPARAAKWVRTAGATYAEYVALRTS